MGRLKDPPSSFMHLFMRCLCDIPRLCDTEDSVASKPDENLRPKEACSRETTDRLDHVGLGKFSSTVIPTEANTFPLCPNRRER